MTQKNKKRLYKTEKSATRPFFTAFLMCGTACIGQKFVQKNKQKMGIKLGEKLCKNQAKDLGLKMCKNWTIKLSKKFYQKIVRKNWQKLGKKLFHACFRVISGNTVNVQLLFPATTTKPTETAQPVGKSSSTDLRRCPQH